MIRFDTGDHFWDGYLDERHRAQLPPVNTLDAHICPECRYQGVKKLEFVEPDLEFGDPLTISRNLRDTMIATPCGCHINLRQWQLAGYRYSDQWTAWEWRGEPRVPA